MVTLPCSQRRGWQRVAAGLPLEVLEQGVELLAADGAGAISVQEPECHGELALGDVEKGEEDQELEQGRKEGGKKGGAPRHAELSRLAAAEAGWGVEGMPSSAVMREALQKVAQQDIEQGDEGKELQQGSKEGGAPRQEE